MSLNNIEPSNNQINSDDIQSTSEIDPNGIKIKFKSHPKGIEQSSSVTISDLNNDCLEALFSYFTLFEWVIVFRLVCKRWHDVLQPMCAKMFYSQSASTNDPDDQPNLQLQPKGNFFFKRIHMIEYFNPRYFNKNCLKYTNQNEERYSVQTMDRFYQTFNYEINQIESFVVKSRNLCFKDENLKLLLLHMSNYWETKNRDARKKVLISISIFGYVTDLSTEHFSQTMSKFMASINQSIQNIFQNVSKLGIFEMDIYERREIYRINLRNSTLFRELCPILQQYAIQYSGKCPLKFGSQLSQILNSMRPFKIIQNFLHSGVRNSPWNERIHSFVLGATNCEQILQYVWANIGRIDQMYIPSFDQNYFDFIKLLRKIAQVDAIQYLAIENVSFDCQALMDFDAERMSKNIITSTKRLTGLILYNVKWIYPADDATDEETRFKIYGILALNLLAELMPNLELLIITSSDASFVENTKKKCLEIFENLKSYSIRCQ